MTSVQFAQKAGALLLGVGFLLVVWIGLFTPQSTPVVELATQQDTLGSDEYLSIVDELHRLVEEEDPTAAIAYFREQLSERDAVASSCHPLAHEIGYASYDRYGDFGTAMEHMDDVCNGGFIHGVIEKSFATADSLVAELDTACDPFAEDPYIAWQCLHGLGHGLMFFTDNDLPASIASCETLSDDDVSACVNGVFMENFTVDQKLHVSDYVDPQDPYSICRSQQEVHKADCYVYAPVYWLSLHADDGDRFTSAAQACAAEGEWEAVCVDGVGGEAMKQHIGDIGTVERICETLPASQQGACIGGALSYYAFYAGSVEEALPVCDGLYLPKNQQQCREALATGSSLFAL